MQLESIFSSTCLQHFDFKFIKLWRNIGPERNRKIRTNDITVFSIGCLLEFSKHLERSSTKNLRKQKRNYVVSMYIWVSSFGEWLFVAGSRKGQVE